jgi:L-alanine-DL-glutamate epimerase-like enolase superfamily enzyme
MAWRLKLFEETPVVDKGDMSLSDKPGFGLAFNQDAVRRFAA